MKVLNLQGLQTFYNKIKNYIVENTVRYIQIENTTTKWNINGDHIDIPAATPNRMVDGVEVQGGPGLMSKEQATKLFNLSEGGSGATFASGQAVSSVSLTDTLTNDDNVPKGKAITSALSNINATTDHVDGFIVWNELDTVPSYVDKKRLTSRYAVLYSNSGSDTSKAVIGILNQYGNDAAKYILVQVLTTSINLQDGVLQNTQSFCKVYQYVRYKALNASGASKINEILGTSISANEFTKWQPLYPDADVEVITDEEINALV